MTAVFDRFTEDAKMAMTLARQASQRLHHNYLGTEHILFGILEVDDPVSRKVFSALRVDRTGLRRDLELLVKAGSPSMDQRQLPFTPRAKKVLELAIDAVRRLDDNHLGTEHLLLGLIREEEGVAAQALKKVGMTWENSVEVLSKISGRGGAGLVHAPAGAFESLLRLAKSVLEEHGESTAARAVEEAIARIRQRG